MSLRFLDAAVYLNTLRNIYEAYVMYQFFMLLIDYVGGEQDLERKLSTRAPVPHPWPFRRCCKPIEVKHPNFLLRMRRGIMQFVIVKPLLAVVTIVLVATGLYNEGRWQVAGGYMWVTVLDNASITVAFYCLVLSYMTLKEDLAPYRPVLKFLCIKAIIFFTFWQGVVVSGLTAINVIHDIGQYTAENVAVGLQDFLICIEMPFFALLHGSARAAAAGRATGRRVCLLTPCCAAQHGLLAGHLCEHAALQPPAAALCHQRCAADPRRGRRHDHDVQSSHRHTVRPGRCGQLSTASGHWRQR